MKVMTLSEVAEAIKKCKKGTMYPVSWITDVIPLEDGISPETGEVTHKSVTCIATGMVRFNINYDHMKSVIDKKELASRTKTIGGAKVVSRKRDPWWEHDDEEGSSFVFHKDDSSLPSEKRRWYVQMFNANARRIRGLAGRRYEVTPVKVKISYVLMMGTKDEEVFTDFRTEKGRELLEKIGKEKLEKLRAKRSRPTDVWLKPASHIISIGSR